MIKLLPVVLSPPGVTVPQIQKEHHIAQQTGQTSLEITRNKSINQSINLSSNFNKRSITLLNKPDKQAFMQQSTNQAVLNLQSMNHLKEIYSLQ